MTSDDPVRAALESDEAFIKAFSRIRKEELRMSAAEFSESSGIPASTIYKLLSGHHEPDIKTLRQIVSILRKMEGNKGGGNKTTLGRMALRHTEPSQNRRRV